MPWIKVCHIEDLVDELGVCSLIGGQQIAIFKVGGKLYALDNHDPFSEANVLSRGLVGEIKGQLVVASPVYKQHFSLESGQCLEDKAVTIATHGVRVKRGTVEILPSVHSWEVA